MMRDPEVAEDLAQETILTAWQNRANLRDAAVWQSWLMGIARNLCARHLRRITIERKRIAPRDDSQTPLSHAAEQAPDNSLPDPEAHLERAEIAHLLDRALGALPRNTHELLIARYVDNLSLAEIAQRRGVREEAAAVQLHRSRQALRRALIGPTLRDESAALGLLPSDNMYDCTETRIWCPKCGQRHLWGRLVRKMMPRSKRTPCGGWEAGTPEEATEFLLFCPTCDSNKNFLCAMNMFHSARNGQLLDGIKGIKPAYRRINLWWESFARTATQQRTVPCIRCGTASTVVTEIASPESRPVGAQIGEKTLVCYCPQCGFSGGMSVMDIALTSAEGQQFWNDQPRLIARPEREILSADGPILVSRLESVTSSATLDVILRADTLEIVRTERY